MFALSIANLYSQESSRFKATLHTEFNKQTSTLELNSYNCTLGSAPTTVDQSSLDNMDRFYLTVGSVYITPKELLKLFETKTQNVNGYIEIIDTATGTTARKVAFKNATYVISESFSSASYGEYTYISITIYTNNLVIDGVSVYSK